MKKGSYLKKGSYHLTTRHRPCRGRSSLKRFLDQLWWRAASRGPAFHSQQSHRRNQCPLPPPAVIHNGDAHGGRQTATAMEGGVFNRDDHGGPYVHLRAQT